jgi:hypothetical protein
MLHEHEKWTRICAWNAYGHRVDIKMDTHKDTDMDMDAETDIDIQRFKYWLLDISQ